MDWVGLSTRLSPEIVNMLHRYREDFELLADYLQYVGEFSAYLRAKYE